MPPSRELLARVHELMDERGWSYNDAAARICAMDRRKAINAAGGRRSAADFDAYESLRPDTWSEPEDMAFAHRLTDTVVRDPADPRPRMAGNLLDDLGVRAASLEEQRRAVAGWLEENEPMRSLVVTLDAIGLLPDGYPDPDGTLKRLRDRRA